jgi:two-component system KDP operon response regulator KdpE
MPYADGWETCRQIRKLADTPIIMLTAIKDENAEVRALDMGAVDFVTKPFSPKVLLARARVALRQPVTGEQETASGYQDDYLTVDIVRRRVLVKGKPLKLTKTEFELLVYLADNEGWVSTFEQILDNVWGAGYEDNPDYVHVYVSRLRQKIEADPRQPRYLLSERGVGYRFEGKVLE